MINYLKRYNFDLKYLTGKTKQKYILMKISYYFLFKSFQGSKIFLIKLNE